MSGNDLTYFEVTGHYLTVVAPDGESSGNEPLFEYLNADVTFFPRVASGFAVDYPDLNIEDSTGPTDADTAVTLAPIKAKIVEGELVSLDKDSTPGVKLVADDEYVTGALYSTNLFYDVRFDPPERGQQMPPSFAFKAPTDDTSIVLTDSSLERETYDGPEL